MDVLHKESSAPFFFTIYILKSVFCKDNSVKYGFDRCVEFYVENGTAEDNRNMHALETRSQSSPRSTAPSESFAGKFVVIKHFA